MNILLHTPTYEQAKELLMPTHHDNTSVTHTIAPKTLSTPDGWQLHCNRRNTRLFDLYEEQWEAPGISESLLEAMEDNHETDLDVLEYLKGGEII